MSVATLTGIPRGTVIRKLNKLIKSKHLIIDKRKLYTCRVKNTKEGFWNKITSKNILRLSVFVSKILNLAVTSK